MRSGSDPSSLSGVRQPNSNRLDEVRYLDEAAYVRLPRILHNLQHAAIMPDSKSYLKAASHRCLLTYSQAFVSLVSQSVRPHFNTSV